MIDLTVTRLPKRGTCHPIVVEGELDICGSPQLQKELAAILNDHGNGFGQGDRIVIHTEGGEFVLEDGRSFSSAGLGYIDASGLHAMVGGLMNAQERGGSVCLVASNPGRVRQVLSIVGLDKVFATYEDSAAPYLMD